MQVVLAAIVGLVLFLVGCIHVYWLLGGRGGFAIAVPTRSNTKQPFFKPRRPEIAAVILIFWGAAALTSHVCRHYSDNRALMAACLHRLGACCCISIASSRRI